MSWPSDAEAFRAAVREWCRTHVPTGWRAAQTGVPDEEYVGFQQAWPSRAKLLLSYSIRFEKQRAWIPVNGIEVRTPVVLAACEDESVLGGVPFYVMRFEEGDVITTQVPEDLYSPPERRRIC